MSITGIIAEFNPFHNGHSYLISRAEQNESTVICALSGNFVQRGDVAVFSKEERTRAALAAGADIVVEIPSIYSMSTAQSFAMCGVWQLYNMGCEKIIFGSESGDISALLRTADILMSDEYAAKLTSLLKSGDTFAKSRETAALACGADISLLRSPNDNLGIEYILAAKKMRLNISFEAVKREGSLHDSAPNGKYASGSYIRALIKSGDFETARKYTPSFTHCLLNEKNVADISRIERVILALLRTKTPEDFKNLPDLSEGIENRLFEAVKTSSSLDELYEKVKSKRYPLARVRRLVLSAALGFDNSFFLTSPPYTRILGASDDGVSALKNTASISPVLVKPADIIKLDSRSEKLFRFENTATDIYNLCFSVPRPCKTEYTMKFIKR